MLSTNHLGLQENYDARSNALTLANGLKFCTRVTDVQKSRQEHLRILCQAAICELLSQGIDIPFIGPDERNPFRTHDYLPVALQPMLSLGDYGIQNDLLYAYREAYANVAHHHPELLVIEEAVAV